MSSRFCVRFGFALALFAASAGAVPVKDGRLGSACTATSECAPSLFCWGPERAASAIYRDFLPAGGLCTRTCSADDDCQALSDGASCSLDVCFEGCQPNSGSGVEFDPGKCHGRPDMACDGNCSPRCAVDSECGPGWFCQPGLGMCTTRPPAGDPPGTPCESPGLTCASVLCDGVCRESCTIGAPLSCSSSAVAGVRAAACVPSNFGSATGDLGYCVAPCACSSDCAEGMVCERWDLDDRLGAPGVCAAGSRATGAPDCLDGQGPKCALGARHACKTETCLGTATCLPSGEYSECQCVSPDGGGEARSDQQPERPSDGCSTAGRHAGNGGLGPLMSFVAACLFRKWLRGAPRRSTPRRESR